MTYDILRRFFALYHLELISRAVLMQAIKQWQRANGACNKAWGTEVCK